MFTELLKLQLIPSSKEFYNQKSALRISVSKNGIFFEIANATGKTNTGKSTFGWRGKDVEDSETVKLSETEVINIKSLIEIFFSEGENRFKSEVQKICGKNHLELYHKTETGDKIILLTPYKGKLFLTISVSKNRRLNFAILPSEQRAIRYYLDYIVDRKYQINDSLKQLEILQKENY